MAQSRLSRPPRALRRARLDNVALVSGDLLPYHDAWQAIANRLPRRAVLIVLPKRNATQRAIMLSVAKALSATGHQVRVIPEAEVR